ncbi:MAG: C39 family peptidase [Microcoleaceae cyanobacterium]
MSTDILTYIGPTEFLVNQSTVITGKFNPQEIDRISLMAEGKYPLNITQNNTLGLWHAILETGFNAPGNRWLQLIGTQDIKNDAVVSQQTINITVKTEPNVYPFLTLITLKDTLFQEIVGDPANLTDEQKTDISVGEIYQLNNYKLVDNYLQVELTKPIPPIGKFGYFNPQQIQLTKGAKILYFNRSDLAEAPPVLALLWVIERTQIKTKPEPYTQLAHNQQFELTPGETYPLRGYAKVEGHFRVSLTQPIPGFGDTGFIQPEQVQILRQGEIVPYSQTAIALKILNNTILKKQPTDEVYLKPQEKLILQKGMVYGVSSYTYQNSHMKVVLTENLPELGNVGYLYPDFVQLTESSQTFATAAALTFLGPTEVLVDRRTLLRGTYDPSQGKTVTVTAEDKYPLQVTLNSASGTWEVLLSQGFNTTGTRWLRLKTIDSRGNVTDSKVVNIYVSSEPISAGEDIKLRTIAETIFKVSPTDAINLNDRQKVTVKKGETFTVEKYGLVDGYLKVVLDRTLAPVGNFGYFYEPHVEMTKGLKPLIFDLVDVSGTYISAKMLVVQKTLMKGSPEDSSQLLDNQKVELSLGETLDITGYASTKGHFRVTLLESIPGFGNVGYIYWQHVQIKKQGEEILYDPNAITMTVRETSVIKKRPLFSFLLGKSERVTLPLGRVYGINSYAIEGNHVKVALTEQLPDFGNTGYVYPNYFLFQRGSKPFNPINNKIELNVPYFSQRDNPRFYWSTCNVTSIAMVFAYYGVRAYWGGQLEDELLGWCFNNYGQGSETDHSVLSALIRAYGFETSFSTTRQWSDINNELNNRRPVVVAGDFTASGHILTAIGYTYSGYIVNDPWGNALTGYSDTEGSRLIYPYNYMDRVAGPDGGVWAHFIRKK